MEKKAIYEGKAKIMYTTDDPDVLLVYYKDDATAGNGAKKGTIENKGIMNNKMSAFFFDLLAKEGIKHQKAIIQSMTYKERMNHLIIGPARRKRIAKGSGTSVAEVNKLLKQFEKTRLTMKKLSRNKGMQAKLMQGMGMFK